MDDTILEFIDYLYLKLIRLENIAANKEQEKILSSEEILKLNNGVKESEQK